MFPSPMGINGRSDLQRQPLFQLYPLCFRPRWGLTAVLT